MSSSNSNNTGTAKGPTGISMSTLTIPERTLIRDGCPAGKLSILKLEEIHAKLKKIHDLQEPKDFRLDLADLEVSFMRQSMLATSRYFGQDVFCMTETGAQQLAREVLPSRFFHGLRQLIHIDAEGRELATKTWHKFNSTNPANIRVVRTIRTKVGGEVRRAIRSVVSVDYGVVSNLAFVEDLLNHSTELAKLPVVDFRLTDSVMRLRFAEIDAPTQMAMFAGEDAVLRSPVPMIEVWNSEVGLRRVGLRAGMWRLISLASCTHWSEQMEKSWIHRGSGERIRRQLTDVHSRLLQASYEVVTAYNEAKEIQIENMDEWLVAKLTDAKLSQHMIEAVKVAMNHPTTTRDGSLAQVVDAICLAAQSCADPVDQFDTEKVAAKLLEKRESFIRA